MIFVITGLPSQAARRTEAERLSNWAFRQFALREAAEAGDHLAEAEVWMGAQSRVGLVLPEDLSILVPVSGGAEVEAFVSYRGPIAAPITAGQEIAHLVLEREGMPEMRLPLVAGADVPEGSVLPRVQTALRVLMGKARPSFGAASAPEATPAETDASENEPAAEPAAEEGVAVD